MGITDFFLKKGRGVGELKELGKEHWLNADIIRALKELDEVDKKASNARKNKDYGTYFSCIRSQLSLIEKVDHYTLVRLVRTEYNYREIMGVLKQAENDYREKAKRIQDEERKLRQRLGKPGDTDINTLKKSIQNANMQLHHFENRIDQMRKEIELVRSHFRKQCKLKINKIRKIYRFA